MNSPLNRTNYKINQRIKPITLGDCFLRFLVYSISFFVVMQVVLTITHNIDWKKEFMGWGALAIVIGTSLGLTIYQKRKQDELNRKLITKIESKTNITFITAKPNNNFRKKLHKRSKFRFDLIDILLVKILVVLSTIGLYGSNLFSSGEFAVVAVFFLVEYILILTFLRDRCEHNGKSINLGRLLTILAASLFTLPSILLSYFFHDLGFFFVFHLFLMFLYWQIIGPLCGLTKDRHSLKPPKTNPQKRSQMAENLKG